MGFSEEGEHLRARLTFWGGAGARSRVTSAKAIPLGHPQLSKGEPIMH